MPFWDKLHSLAPLRGCFKEIPNFLNIAKKKIGLKKNFLHSLTTLQGRFKEILNIALKKISLHLMTPPSEQPKENLSKNL